MKRIIISLIFGVLSMCSVVRSVTAQELIPSQESLVKARVVELVSETIERLPNNSTPLTTQELRVEILRGERKGEEITLLNDYIPLEEGDRFIMKITQDPTGPMYYTVSDFERRPVLIILFILFAGAVLALAGKQGVRSIASLFLSFATIFFVLVPLMLRGYSPVLVGSGVAILILFVAIVITHGFKKTSFIAFAGTSIAVLITGLLAYAVTYLSHMTGYSSHEAVYLNFNTGGTIDFVGLYLAGVIIGMLGVLDDISITQVAVVRELREAMPHATRAEVFVRALRVGKEHVSALVNTLVLAYAGVALPTILYFATSSYTPWELINQELFASEIIRTLIGSLGLILAVPLTTFLALHVHFRPGEGHDHGHAHHHHH